MLSTGLHFASESTPTSREGFGADELKWPGFQFDCPHCGKFIVDEMELNHLLGYLNPPSMPGVAVGPLQLQRRQRALLAHALRRMGASSKTPTLTNGMTLRILEENRLPTLAEQRDRLLRWFGSDADLGRMHPIGWDSFGARVGTESPDAFKLLLEGMQADGLLQGTLGADPFAQFRLTYRGLERLEQLERAAPSGNNAFMAMQYNDSVLDRIVRDYFQPAVEETGFRLFRLDDRPEAGLIDARLRNEIRNCRFLIADLSHANAGSYWEAGYAEGLGKPVIYTCEQAVFDGKAATPKPHFDTNHHLTITWAQTDPQLAANRLRETIEFTIPEARQRN
jgi:hypothetical protein